MKNVLIGLLILTAGAVGWCFIAAGVGFVVKAFVLAFRIGWGVL